MLISGNTDCRKCKNFYKIKMSEEIKSGSCLVEKHDLLIEDKNGSFRSTNGGLCRDYIYDKDYDTKKEMTIQEAQKYHKKTKPFKS